MGTVTTSAVGELQMIAVDELHESPLNPRRYFAAGPLAELTESVRQSGVRVPLIARPWPKDVPNDRIEDGYEVAAGHRRLRAARRAGVATVPVIVREMDDAEFLEVLTFENTQREDVQPLEEASGYRVYMEQTGADVATVAAKIGQSTSYVYQRLKLLALIGEGQRALIDGAITAGHAILIARLSEPDQKRALEMCKPPKWDPDRKPSVRDLQEWLHRDVFTDLERAPFDRHSAELVPVAGSCDECPKRSGNAPELWPDVAGPDVCTDPVCYAEKVNAWVAVEKARLVKIQGEAVALTKNWTAPKGATGVLPAPQWDQVEDSATGKNVKLAVMVDGPEAGRVLKVRVQAPPAAASGTRSPSSVAESKASQKERQAAAAAERIVRRKIWDAIAAKVKWPLLREDWALILGELLMGDIDEKFVAGLGLSEKEIRNTELVAAKIKGMADRDLAKLVLGILLSGDVEPAEWMYKSEPAELYAAARRYGVDPAAIRRGAVTKPADAPAQKATASKGEKLTPARKRRMAAAKAAPAKARKR
jgi:ParB/RepB/Spo0J family partition protein